jgi:uroporphyrinogen-III decarboxylase
MVKQLSSRERMLTALNCGTPDHPPCSFMLFGALLQKSNSYLDFIASQLKLGLDAYVMLPPRPPVVVNDHYNLYGLPVSYAPEVTIEEAVISRPGEDTPELVKTYHTPAGNLTTRVRKTSDWRWGEHVPFLDDYLIPRSKNFIIQEPDDLEAFQYLLAPPTDAEIKAFKQETAPILDYARAHQLLTTGGWGVGADMIGWVHGLDHLLFNVYDRPDFVCDLLAMIGAWNRQRMAVILEAEVDLFIKRAWYENTDFFSPKSWEALIQPELQKDVDLAHQAGAKFGYIITASAMPLLEKIAQTGVDVIIGIDPHAYDLTAIKDILGGRVCLWGGINGHLTVEHGQPPDVQREATEALALLGPDGLILSPVDNIREDTPQAWDNFRILIETWQEQTRQSP